MLSAAPPDRPDKKTAALYNQYYILSWAYSILVHYVFFMLMHQDKLEIKKDKKGLVFIQGAAVKAASNAKELLSLFEEGSKNRHTASTSQF